MNRFSCYALFSCVLAAGGCSTASKPAPKQLPKVVAPAASTVKAEPTPDLNFSDEILKACGLQAISEKAPHFDFDSADLSPGEKDQLVKFATCLTDGPLKGRTVQLVGRADPRGEQEYNMSLGSKRAYQVGQYLRGLGVGEGLLSYASRGSLDAVGKDEQGYRQDRRVDILLQDVR